MLKADNRPRSLPDRLGRLRLPSRMRRIRPFNIFVYIMLITLSFMFLYPFIYMLATSFKSYADTLDATVKWYPREFTPGNWAEAFKRLGLFDFSGFENIDGASSFFSALWGPKGTFFNSLTVVVCSTVGHILSCSLIAYGFSRFRFRGRGFLFVLVIVTIIVPLQTIIVPQYSLYSTLFQVFGNGSYAPLIVPTFFGLGLNGGLFIFLFRQSFMKLPPSLEEATSIDGCNPYRTFFGIIIPSSGPVLLVCSILSVVWHWNDYFAPFMYINSPGKYLVPQVIPDLLAQYEKLQTSVDVEALAQREVFSMGTIFAAAAIVVAPLVIMYFILQGKFTQSIDRTGLVE